MLGQVFKGNLHLGVVLVSWIFIFTATVSCNRCPYGWQDYPGSKSCYLITEYQVRYTFDTARDKCISHQAELVHIDSEAEMHWLDGQISEITYAPPRMGWWIGLQDLGQGMKYLNGSDPDLSLFPWPGLKPPLPSPKRKCAYFAHELIFDDECTRWLGMVCERSKAIPLSCDVDDGWTYINGSCFKLVNSKVSWSSARETCQRWEGDLATMDTLNELTYVMMGSWIIKEPSWIGFHSYYTNTTPWYKWVNGSDLDRDQLWMGDNEPKPIPPLQKDGFNPGMCGLVDPDNRRSAAMGTDLCNATHIFTCMKPEGNCADGWIQHKSMCIKFYPEYKLSWTSARKYCQDLGGDLMEIKSQSFQVLMTNYFQSLQDAGVQSLWIGLWDSGFNIGYSWVSGGFLDSQNFTNWADGFPENAYGKECGFVSTADFKGKWQTTVKCEERRSFVCSISGSSVVKDVPPPKSDIKCDGGWEPMGDSCVYLSNKEDTWYQAKLNCDELLAQLMVVNSVEAQGYLDSKVKAGQYWIGLHDRPEEAIFSWVDGTKYNFTNWASGQPDNKENENCVVVQGSSSGAQWYDMSCQNVHPYICQKQPRNTQRMDIDPAPKPDADDDKPISGKCGLTWEERPGQDLCYQFVEKTLTWTDALEMCQKGNGSLLSIGSRDEQSYIEGRLKALKSKPIFVWIGASDRALEAGWRWEDGSPFAFLNWNPGEPNDYRDTEDCAAINVASMMWYDYKCDRRSGFVCKKTVSTGSSTVPTTQPTVPAGKHYGCPQGWLAYDNSCFLMRQKAISWTDADTACKKEGAELASISNTKMNDFVFSQLPRVICEDSHSDTAQCNAWAKSGECHANPSWMKIYCHASCDLCDACVDKHTHHECKAWADADECNKNPDYMWLNCLLSCGCWRNTTTGYWLGLNDHQSQMTFVWSDHSDVTYTNWMRNEPDNYDGNDQDCVLMHTRNGEWSDEECSTQSSGYVCEKPIEIQDGITVDPKQTGCPFGAFGYGATCYIVVDSPKRWADAKDYCSSSVKGHLATIPDSVTSAFVVSELLRKTSSFWIGLSNTDANYKWDSGAAVDYTSWNPSHTGNEKNSCVAMRSQPPVGLWENTECLSPLPFICETDRRGFTKPPTTTTPGSTTLAECPPSWKGFKDHCYQMFSERKVWFAAQFDCQLYGGNLASLPDAETNNFVNNDLFNRYSVSGGFWIGLTDADKEKTFKWIDDTPFDYSHWHYGEPNGGSDGEDCVESYTSYSGWNDNSCYITKPYVCAIARGVPLPTMPPTTPTLPVPQCADLGWVYFNAYCYYISPNYGTDAALTWFESRRKCMDMGGDLASISNGNENNFLISLASKSEKEKFWIGFNQLNQKSYRWSDGTSSLFLAWGAGEPNDGYGGERCVDLSGIHGIWIDDDCMKDQGYICKKMNDSTTSKIPFPTPIINGPCPDGFVSEGVTNKCYYLGGLGDDTSKDPKLGWVEARDKCRNLTSPNLVDIASINSLIDQDFVTLMLSKLDGNLWIGMSDRVTLNTYTWQDNTEVTYTNWASGQPRTHWTKDCVEMLRNPDKSADTAKWNPTSCHEKKAYLCQTMKEPQPPNSSPPSTTKATATQKCPTNFYLHGSDCFSTINQPKTWQEARKACQFFNGDLASTLDVFEVASVDLALYNNHIASQAWIGMKFDTESSKYVWVDKWPVTNTFWSADDPNLQTNDSCVAFSKASWNDTLCEEKLPYICEVRSGTPPTPTPTPTGHCPDSSYVRFGDFCYMAKPDEKMSWPEAAYTCGVLGMKLASVHSAAENSFIKGLINLVSKQSSNNYYYSHPDVWLGLHRDEKDGFRWDDDTPATYYNWDKGEPNSVKSKSNTYDEECGHMFRKTGKWNDLPCIGQSLGYICKVGVVLPATIPTVPLDFVSITTTTTTTASKNKIPTQKGDTIPCNKGPCYRRSVSKPEESSTLTGGQVAGIVIGVIGFCIIVAVIVIIIKKRDLPFKPVSLPMVSKSGGFSNALYVRDDDESKGDVNLGNGHNGTVTANGRHGSNNDVTDA